jgi:Ca2+-binding RTX toxin-like protein
MRRSAIETLETRVMFAADPLGSAVLEGGTLLVSGTRRADEIRVSVNATDATRLDVVINGAAPATFALSDVTNGIRIEGGNGHDTLSVDGALSLDAVLLGGNGRDDLSGGGGDDRLEGGNGADRLGGRGGNDALLGGNGSDTLEGGDGNDTLEGGRGKDRVTGGAGSDAFKGDAASEILDEAPGESLTEGARGERHG